MKPTIVSLFAGCGGLDLGFTQAGFNCVYANEYDPSIWDTYRLNHPGVPLDMRSIRDVPSSEVPSPHGIIGGPPCQSWSEAGAQRGIKDSRGQLFYEYIRLLEDKQPEFFLAENVSGMLHAKHADAVRNILLAFESVGYIVRANLLNAKYFGVPQDRKRVIYIGYHERLRKRPLFPKSDLRVTTLKGSKWGIWDLRDSATPAADKNRTNGDLNIPNHEYMTGGFSTIYMSRNRVRAWNEPSFTIQAGGRHAPCHPQAPKMRKLEQDKREFIEEQEHLYRRLRVRECARVQTFPDDFVFRYDSITDGYKMIGNAVPVEFSRRLAAEIYNDLYASEQERQKSHDEDDCDPAVAGPLFEAKAERDHVSYSLEEHKG